MIRTQIQLAEQQVTILKQLATLQHTSMAELIRRAVDLFTESSDAGNIQERRQRALAASGQFRSGSSDLSARHDDYLAEALKLPLTVISRNRALTAFRINKSACQTNFIPNLDAVSR